MGSHMEVVKMKSLMGLKKVSQNRKGGTQAMSTMVSRTGYLKEVQVAGVSQS